MTSKNEEKNHALCLEVDLGQKENIIFSNCEDASDNTHDFNDDYFT